MLIQRYVLCAHFHLITHIWSIGIPFHSELWFRTDSNYLSMSKNLHALPLNDEMMIIMVMSSFNASICTMNSHTYIELLLLLLSHLLHISAPFTVYSSEYVYFETAHFSGTLKPVHFPNGPVHNGHRLTTVGPVTWTVRSLHCIFDVSFSFSSKSYIVSVIRRSISSIQWIKLPSSIWFQKHFVLNTNNYLNFNVLTTWINFIKNHGSFIEIRWKCARFVATNIVRCSSRWYSWTSVSKNPSKDTL